MLIENTTVSETPEWLSPGGRWSQAAPLNCREVEAWRFHAAITQWAIVHTVYRQCQVPGERHACSGKWFILNCDESQAWGVVATGGTDYKFFMAGACQHEMVRDDQASRMCYTVSNCRLCGYYQEVDSSG